MKKLLTILLVLISFSSFAQFEAGEYINTNTVKIDGTPLLLNIFKKDSLGGAGNIFYSTGASSQPASGTVNQVIGGNLLSGNYVPKWDGSKLANSDIFQDLNRNVGIGTNAPASKLEISGGNIELSNDYRLGWRYSAGDGNMYNSIVNSYTYNGGIQYKSGSWSSSTTLVAHNFQTWMSGAWQSSLAISQNGNVGIGTTTPLSKLSINGGLHVGGDSDAGDNNILADGTITGTQLISNIPTGTAPLSITSTTLNTNLNADLLDGQNGDYYAKYSVETLGDNVDFNSIMYGRFCAIQTQPIHVLNYTGQINTPFQGYGQLVTFNSIGGAFPFQIASKQNNGGLFYRSHLYAPMDPYSFETPWQSIYSSGNSNISTVDWNAKQYISHVPTGTPPLVVASSTKVDSLNAGLLDGKKASDFQLKSDTLTFDATLSDLADSSAAIRALANTKAVVSGTNNYIPKITGANMLGNSVLIENNGKIGIDFTEPIAKLHVVESTILDSTQGAYQIITSEQGNAGNRFRNNKWMIRDLNGKDWYTAIWHDGISIDNTFNIPRNNTRTWWERNPYGNIQRWGSGGTTYFTLNGANAGFGTTSPAARIHSQSTGTQARLGYDANKYTDLSTGSTGNLTIDPTGDTVKVVGAVNSTGGFSTTAKSNLNDVIGDSAVFANMKMTYGAGINKIIYSDATGNFVWGNQSSTLLAIAGVTPSTGYLYYNGSTFSYASGGSAQWTADTYGIKYTAGKVGIGIGSDSGNLLTVGDGSTNTNIAIKASSLNQRAIFATSSSNTAIVGQGGLDGVYGVGTRYGVQGSSTSSNGVRGASTNAAGISGTSTYSYGGEFSGLGVNISSGGLLINGTTRISSTGTFTPSNGASGSFTSADGKTITVTNGIITGIN